MKLMKLVSILVLLVSFAAIGCGKDKKEALHNGVLFAANALRGASANPLSAATYQGYVGNGGNPVTYIKAVLPKTDPPFDSFEFGKPTHPWTVVVRQGTAENEFSIEGYADNLSMPEFTEEVTMKLPAQD